MQVDFIFLADSASQRPDGRIDAIAIGAFTVMAAHFPAECERFAVIVRGSFEPDESDPTMVHIQVIAPGGSRIAEREVTIAPPEPLLTPKPEGRVRSRVVNFYHVPVPEPGTYNISTTVNGITYIGAHFDAVLASEPSVASGTVTKPAMVR
jgi:hypothetical protein